jgi:hypothetical protein
MSRPKATIEARIAGSTKGSGTPMKDAAKPAAINDTKVAGTAQTARPPIIAAQTPTATIARMWSTP